MDILDPTHPDFDWNIRSVYWINNEIVTDYWDPEQYLINSSNMPSSLRNPKEFIKALCYDFNNTIGFWLLDRSGDKLVTLWFSLAENIDYYAHRHSLNKVKEYFDSLNIEEFKKEYKTFCTTLMLMGFTIKVMDLEKYFKNFYLEYTTYGKKK